MDDIRVEWGSESPAARASNEPHVHESNSAFHTGSERPAIRSPYSDSEPRNSLLMTGIVQCR